MLEKSSGSERSRGRIRPRGRPTPRLVALPPRPATGDARRPLVPAGGRLASCRPPDNRRRGGGENRRPSPCNIPPPSRLPRGSRIGRAGRPKGQVACPSGDIDKRILIVYINFRHTKGEDKRPRQYVRRLVIPASANVRSGKYSGSAR